MAALQSMNLVQNLIGGKYCNETISTVTIQLSSLNAELLSVFDHSLPLGISPGVSSRGRLAALAIADNKYCRIIEFDVSWKKPEADRISSPKRANLQLLQDKVLCRAAGDLYAFDMGPLCMLLHSDFSLLITSGVDIQSATSAVNRRPAMSVEDIVGDSVPIMKTNIVNVFQSPVYDREDRNQSTDLAMRAWLSQFLAHHQAGEMIFAKVPRIDTRKLGPASLSVIAKLSTDALRLDQTKPIQTTNRVQIDAVNEDGEASLKFLAFNDRIRSQKRVKVTYQGTNTGQFTLPAMVTRSQGKSGVMTLPHSMSNEQVVLKVVSIGRDDSTTAEAKRAAAILCILQGSHSLLEDNSWIHNIWFSRDDDVFSWPKEWSEDSGGHGSLAYSLTNIGNLGCHKLNASQQVAVNTMLSTLDEHRITIIQGPPGTGKTSVIASFVQLAIAVGYRGLWLVAQSNVAVKNIAEKLHNIGFTAWKLLVSKDFYFEWHEHLYVKVQDNIIRSESFHTLSLQSIKDCKVFLCTLAMLSNPFISKFTQVNPLKTIIVDEASQIEIGNYVSIFLNFKTLRKACFIGDDRQLPPFGQEDIQDLQSIFEFSHLRKNALFLNIQYRMPPQIGNIISTAVYDQKLKSNPQHPVLNSACYFINAPGYEKQNKTSFMNLEEAHAVLILAQLFEKQNKNYQIITPYDKQCNYIEEKMKEIPGLQWKNKCFNVDSFQGNEEDYIIISLVRSQELGFLNNMQRMNVMLTRCKKGMYIISSQKFLLGIASKTLAGILLQELGPDAWLEIKDIENGELL